MPKVDRSIFHGCQPASANPPAQQQRFDRWRKEFNQERPHEALDQQTPADLYHPSMRRLDEGIKTRLYEPQQETRRVSASGFISLNGTSCFVGEAFEGVDVAIEREEKSGLLSVRYANVRLGHLENDPNARLRPPAYAGRWEKRACSPE